MSLNKRKKIDWDRIEAEYRIGKLTVRELGEKHGVAFETISRHMKKRGVTRDLSEQVAAATKAAVINSIVNKASSERQQGAVDEIAIAAKVNANVIESHRDGLQTLKGVVQSLALELAAAGRAAAVLAPEEIVSLAEEKGLSATDLTSLLTAAQTASRAATADKLASAWNKLVPLERKTHGLDAEGGGKASTFADVLAEVERLEREYSGGL